MHKTLALFFWCALLAFSQAPTQQQQPLLVSPEVHADHRATFRIQAPQADTVTFFGDWMPTGKQEKMTKDEQGVWSVTLGPLPPSIYLYSFTVDGVTMADPVNPRIKLRSRTSASMVEIAGDSPALWQERDVPHGTVAINWHTAKALGGGTRAVWVYTPPGYEKDAPSRRYPVLYLFHGSNDTAAGWTLAGNANFILDNLLAERKAVPMIVVMPYGHAVPFTAPRDQQAKNTALFEEYVLQDVKPLVESKFRTMTDREHRAIAGLSMGGGQAITVGFNHLDLFSSIAAMSAAVPADFEARFAQALSAPTKTNAQLKTLWIGCGKQDSLFPRSEKFSALLTANQIRHTFRPTEGLHTYTVWRQYLGEVLPLLFR